MFSIGDRVSQKSAPWTAGEVIEFGTDSGRPTVKILHSNGATCWYYTEAFALVGALPCECDECLK